MSELQWSRLAPVVLLVLAMAGCQFKGGSKPAEPVIGDLAGEDGGAVATEVPGNAAAGTVAAGGQRDVEAPEIFSKTDKALWDGRPSLGGIWVAHADVKDPERVVIRNPATGKSVTGALFRREVSNPGPSLQMSSDAAEALGILAGQPTTLQVVALKRVEVAPPPPPPAPPPPPTEPAAKVAGTKAPPKPDASAAAAATAPAAIEQKKLDPVAKTAAEAIDKALKKSAAAPAAAPAPATAAPDPGAPLSAIPAQPAGALSRPYLQIGIFSTEENAKKAAAQMQKAGLAAQVKPEKSQDKTLWRVLIGPAATQAERDAMVAKVKSLGYPDAYAVSK
ncbi:SPOR domain-containing protein [Frigidibacter sp. RF13]|uniref:SPOR domain-containing protein n=1 Tax=Frigidibacter sp. RF13 TaxID=2997340 RepID=UPI00226E2687|nr:SPOR domain-containing protein [Frigidibacter sp. RF13]MCY1128337.1 SPOR domain-containing protein [Frigidibacter sp. RF13]